MKKQGLFLDFDGTLVESVSLLKQAYQQLLSFYHKQESEAEFNAINGPPTRVGIEIIKKNHNIQTDLETLLAQHNSNLIKLYENIPPAPCAVDLIKTAVTNMFVVGIVTSNSALIIHKWLEKNHLAQDVSFVIDGDSVERGKPDPSPYLKALGLSGCLRENSLVVEDSLHGATSALTAGIATALVASGLSPLEIQKLKTSFPSVKMTSLKEVLSWIKDFRGLENIYWREEERGQGNAANQYY